MTWIRSIQSGFEFRDVNELEQYVGKGSATGSINTSNFYTGSAGLSIGTGVRPRGKGLSGSDKVCIRCGCFLKHNGTGSADEAIIFFIPGNSNDITITYDPDDNLVRMKIGSSVVDSDTPSSVGIATTGVWYNCALYVYRHGTNGVISFYVGGELKLQYEGDTGNYNTGVYVGGEETLNAWGGSTYVDDFYAEYSTSEEVDLPPPSYRYDLIRATGDSSVSLSRNTGSTNYQQIDDTTPDDDSTYIYGTSAGLEDKYTMADYTLEVGYTVSSLIPTARVKKTSSGTDAQIQLGLDQSGTEDYATAQSVSTTYGYHWDRFTDDPLNASWTDAKVDSIIGCLQTAGTF